MQNRSFGFGPVALTTVLTTNILNVGTGAKATPPVGFTDVERYIILRRIRIVNKTANSATVSLWKGATGANAAGTEFEVNGTPIPAYSAIDLYGPWRFDTADFLVGGAGTATALTIEGFGEIGCAG